MMEISAEYCCGTLLLPQKLTKEVSIVGKRPRAPFEKTSNPQTQKKSCAENGKIFLKKKKNLITALYLYFFRQWVGLFANISNNEKKNMVDLKNFNLFLMFIRPKRLWYYSNQIYAFSVGFQILVIRQYFNLLEVYFLYFQVCK